MEIAIVILGLLVTAAGVIMAAFKVKKPAEPIAQPPKEIDKYTESEIERINREAKEVADILGNDGDATRARAQRQLDRLRARSKASESDRDDDLER